MKTPRPDWYRREGVDAEEWTDGYELIVRSFGFDYTMQTFGSYQGDHAVVLRDGQRVGWLVIGYGSCSGCDELEAVDPWCHHRDGEPCNCSWAGVVELRDRLLSEVKWGEAPRGPRDPNEWWSFDKGLAEWLVAEYARESA